MPIMLDGTAHHVVSACKNRSRYQEMTAFTRLFSGNDAYENKIDVILDDLRILNLD